MIKLPEPKLKSSISLEEAIYQRRSIREYCDKPLTLQQLSQLLWAAQGITGKDGKRTTPSAGALYPIKIYMVISNVENLDQGIYQYHPQTHEIRNISSEDKKSEITIAALNQQCVRDSAILIILTAVYNQTTVVYGERGIGYIYQETGNIAQNIHLQCISLNLGTVMVGAFNNRTLHKIMNLNKDEDPLCIMPVGIK